jgi:DNA invertase Pin-like site-specific DNA recombinase
MRDQVIGYKRISSPDQNPDRQLLNINLHKEFLDASSGCNKDRPGLKQCLDYVREGDTLVIDSIDRLARNLRDLQEIVDLLVKKGVFVKFIKENLSFSANNDHLATLTLHLMGAFAEFERSMIRSRQKEGIAAAKKLGKNCGRPFVMTDKMIIHAKNMHDGGHSIRDIAKRHNVARATIYKVLKLGKWKVVVE